MKSELLLQLGRTWSLGQYQIKSINLQHVFLHNTRQRVIAACVPTELLTRVSHTLTRTMPRFMQYLHHPYEFLLQHRERFAVKRRLSHVRNLSSNSLTIRLESHCKSGKDATDRPSLSESEA
jgi:hypothetical protein